MALRGARNEPKLSPEKTLPGSLSVAPFGQRKKLCSRGSGSLEVPLYSRILTADPLVPEGSFGRPWEPRDGNRAVEAGMRSDDSLAPAEAIRRLEWQGHSHGRDQAVPGAGSSNATSRVGRFSRMEKERWPVTHGSTPCSSWCVRAR
jgi:hypothetical protein